MQQYKNYKSRGLVAKRPLCHSAILQQLKGASVQGRQGLDEAQPNERKVHESGHSSGGQGRIVLASTDNPGVRLVALLSLSGGRAGRANAVYLRHRPGCALARHWSDSLSTAWRQEIQGAFSKVIVLAFLGRGGGVRPLKYKERSICSLTLRSASNHSDSECTCRCEEEVEEQQHHHHGQPFRSPRPSHDLCVPAPRRALARRSSLLQPHHESTPWQRQPNLAATEGIAVSEAGRWGKVSKEFRLGPDAVLTLFLPRRISNLRTTVSKFLCRGRAKLKKELCYARGIV